MNNQSLQKVLSLLLALVWVTGCLANVRITGTCYSTKTNSMSCCQSSTTMAGTSNSLQIAAYKSCHCPGMMSVLPERGVSLPIETLKTNSVQQTHALLNFVFQTAFDQAYNKNSFFDFSHQHPPANTASETNALLSTFRI
ncbi:MAG TPA: hypothetical protein PLG25_06015 [bacterium]|nr:hypothetical protein [bacterium]HMY37320.1 hypothetical protein [bacterium]HMZ04963.1 hypothetical protein [bacterium]HNB08926.1 hypothetical protein [bacterium]HNB55376.1 hypothetical protein [bacterium]